MTKKRSKSVSSTTSYQPAIFHFSANYADLRPAAPAEKSETTRVLAIRRIQRRRLGVQRHIRAQPQLPGVIVNQVPHAAKRVRRDAIRRMHRRLREKFVLVDQLQPRERVIALAEIQRRFQQIAVQVRVGCDLVHASPHERCRPVARSQRPVVLHRCRLPPLAARLRRLGMLQAPHAVLRRPVGAWAQRWPVPTRNRARAELDAPALFVRLAPVEGRSLQLDSVDRRIRS